MTATDLNPETLAVAAGRDYGPARPLLVTADAYRLDAIQGEFDLVFCGFWWSHVARADTGGSWLGWPRGPSRRAAGAGRQPVRAGQ